MLFCLQLLFLIITYFLQVVAGGTIADVMNVC
jgi:hypothetical protein